MGRWHPVPAGPIHQLTMPALGSVWLPPAALVPVTVPGVGLAGACPLLPAPGDVGSCPPSPAPRCPSHP